MSNLLRRRALLAINQPSNSGGGSGGGEIEVSEPIVMDFSWYADRWFSGTIFIDITFSQPLPCDCHISFAAGFRNTNDVVYYVHDFLKGDQECYGYDIHAYSIDCNDPNLEVFVNNIIFLEENPRIIPTRIWSYTEAGMFGTTFVHFPLAAYLIDTFYNELYANNNLDNGQLLAEFPVKVMPPFDIDASYYSQLYWGVYYDQLIIATSPDASGDWWLWGESMEWYE